MLITYCKVLPFVYLFISLLVCLGNYSFILGSTTDLNAMSFICDYFLGLAYHCLTLGVYKS